jgi:hypothetical protein
LIRRSPAENSNYHNMPVKNRESSSQLRSGNYKGYN